MKLILLICVSFTTGCASLKEMICDCKPDKAILSTSNKKNAVSRRPKPKQPAEKVGAAAQVPAGERVAVESEAERMLDGDVYTAMDSFVFDGDEKQMLVFCQSSQVQCWVNDRRWPKGKKLNKKGLKKAPFMTGAKMGLRGEERIQLRWEFFETKDN